MLAAVESALRDAYGRAARDLGARGASRRRWWRSRHPSSASSASTSTGSTAGPGAASRIAGSSPAGRDSACRRPSAPSSSRSRADPSTAAGDAMTEPEPGTTADAPVAAAARGLPRCATPRPAACSPSCSTCSATRSTCSPRSSRSSTTTSSSRPRAPWAAPYIGDLVGYRVIHGVVPEVASPRAEVANTIAYRRRKGTAAVLEQLARDVTGWPARVVRVVRAARDDAVHEPRPPARARDAPDLRDHAALGLDRGAGRRRSTTSRTRRDVRPIDAAAPTATRAGTASAKVRSSSGAPRRCR